MSVKLRKRREDTGIHKIKKSGSVGRLPFALLSLYVQPNEFQNLNTKIVALEKNIKELQAAMGKNAVDPVEIERKRSKVAAYVEEHERAQREFAEADQAFQKAENELQKVYHELLGVSFAILLFCPHSSVGYDYYEPNLPGSPPVWNKPF